MMTPEIITFLSSACSGILAIAVCIINNKYQNSKTLALLDLRLSTLEEKVDKHNNLIDRTYELEKLTALQEQKIEDIQKGVGK